MGAAIILGMKPNVALMVAAIIITTQLGVQTTYMML